MEVDILKQLAYQLPVAFLFVVFAVYVRRLEEAERERRDQSWMSFIERCHEQNELTSKDTRAALRDLDITVRVLTTAITRHESKLDSLSIEEIRDLLERGNKEGK